MALLFYYVTVETLSRSACLLKYIVFKNIFYEKNHLKDDRAARIRISCLFQLLN